MATAAKDKKTKQEPKKGRGIEDTLSALGIDDDLPPGEAAQQAVSSLNKDEEDTEHPASTVEVEEVEEVEDDEETDDTGGDKDDDDEEDDSDGEDGDTAPAAKLKVPPPRKPPKAKTQPKKEEEDDEVPLPEPEFRVAAPPPKPKPQSRKSSPAAGKLGKGLADKVPGAEKVKVYKRIEGQKHFVNSYTKGDLDQFPDFESFLVRYVKPEHGAGEYDLVGVDAYNRETQLGQIRLINSPRDTNKDAGALHLIETVLQQNKEQNEKWLSRMKETMAPQNQQNPLDLLNGVMTLQEKLNQKAEASKREAASEGGSAFAAAMKAMSESSSQTTQMMMAMMQQNQATMTALLSKPKDEDPVMKLLLMKLLEDKDSGGSGGAAIPPPPPKPTEGLSEILSSMAAFMGAMGGGGGGGDDDEFKSFLQQMLLKQQSDGLSTKEMVQLLLKKDDQPGTDDFRRSIDNMAAIMNVAQNLNRGQEGGPSATLFDALAALFSNRDFAGSIAQTIRAKTDQGATVDVNQLQRERQMIEAEKQRLAMQARLLQRAQLETNAGGAQAPQPGMQQPMQQPGMQQPMQQGFQQPAAPPPPQPQAPPQGVTPEAQKRAEQMALARGIQFPANTHEHVNRMVMAKDDADLVGKTVDMLIYFSEFDEWREFMEGVLGAIREGNKQGSMQVLTVFFEGLAQINMIDSSLAQRAVKLVGEHFEAVQNQLEDLRLERDDQITAEDLLSGDEDDEEDDEEDEDDEDDED